MQSNIAEIQRLQTKLDQLNTLRSHVVSAQNTFEEKQSNRKIRLTGLQDYFEGCPLTEQYYTLTETALSSDYFSNVLSDFYEAIHRIDSEIDRTEDLLHDAQSVPIEQ